MGPPKGSSASNVFGPGGNGDEDILQAVVIADSFNERFMPITLDKPRCLLPLLNVPIIEYTFEFLAISGVQEVILLCRAHADQIKHYIARSRWAKATSTMHIQIVVAPESMSVGDGLREVDSRGLIHGDFILVSGDVLSNMDLGRALEAHRRTRAADKNVIMTMVLKRASPCHRSREQSEGAVFLIDGSTRECLAYEPVDWDGRTKRVSFDIEAFEGHPELTVRHDLMDCQIDICSLNVLALFTENFDYQDMRRDFVRGVLTSDILGYRISTHILREEYAARVRTPRLYAAISRDLIARWMFPIVPESNLLEDQPLTFRRSYQYIAPDAVFSRSAEIGEYCVIGAAVDIREGTRVRNSVIGPGCQIGADCVLEGVFLGEGCTIEAGCKLYHCLLAENVQVKAGSHIAPGCMVTSGVTLGPRADLPPQTRVARLTEHVDVQMGGLGLHSAGAAGSLLDDNGAHVLLSASPPMSAAERMRILGRESDGVIWTGSIDEPDDEEALEAGDEAFRQQRHRAFALDATFKPDPRHNGDDALMDEDDEEESDEEGISGSEISGDEVMMSDLGESDSDAFMEAHSDDGGQARSQFMAEAQDMVRHAIDSSYSIDNAALELNGLKFACNAGFPDCQLAILTALFSRVDGMDLQRSVTKLWTVWGPLLAKFTHGHQEELGLLSMLCTLCRTYGRSSATEAAPFERVFNLCVPLLYKTDVIEEPAVLEWFSAESAVHGEDSLYCRQIKGFVQWLQEEDSDDEDSEEEESDSD